MWDICRLFCRLTFANCIWCKKHEMFVSISPGSVLLEAIALHTQNVYPWAPWPFHGLPRYWLTYKSGARWCGRRAEAQCLEHSSCPCTSQAASPAVFHEWRPWRSPHSALVNIISETFQRLVSTGNLEFSLLHWLIYFISVQFSSVAQLSCVCFSSVVSDSLQPHESQHARPPFPSPTPGVHSDSHPSSQWCHPAISSSVIPLSSCPQSHPASASFPMSQLFAWGGQSTGVSASTSVLPMNTQDWSPSEWTVWISLQSKGLSRVFSNTTVQKHQFFSTQLSSQSNSHIHTWSLEKP